MPNISIQSFLYPIVWTCETQTNFLLFLLQEMGKFASEVQNTLYIPMADWQSYETIFHFNGSIKFSNWYTIQNEDLFNGPSRENFVQKMICINSKKQRIKLQYSRKKLLRSVWGVSNLNEW